MISDWLCFSLHPLHALVDSLHAAFFYSHTRHAWQLIGEGERKINAITSKRSFVLRLRDFEDESYKLAVGQ